MLSTFHSAIKPTILQVSPDLQGLDAIAATQNGTASAAGKKVNYLKLIFNVFALNLFKLVATQTCLLELLWYQRKKLRGRAKI